MNLRICILPSQPMKDGRFKIRIAIAHNKDTRYFVTDCCVSSEKNFKNGQVTGKEAGAKDINIRVQRQLQKIQEAYDKIDGAEFFTCSELVELIKEKMRGEKPKTILEAFDLQTERKGLQGRQPNTIRNYKVARGVVERYFGSTKTIQSLTERDLLKFKKWMDDVEHLHHTDDPKKYRNQKYGLSSTNQRQILSKIKSAYVYAVGQRLFTPDTDIWKDFEMPTVEHRRCSLSIEELRRLRDAVFDDQYLTEVRDLMMLSFYLCGMNLADLVVQDLSQPIVSYRRIKTTHSRPQDEITEFTIQPEARSLIEKFFVEGSFRFRGGVKIDAILNAFQRKLPTIKKLCDIEGRLIYYSARKTFSQLCLELGVPDAVNAYCIGDTPAKSTLNAYRTANRQLADKYIRKVFDFVASNKTLEEAISEL